MISNQPQRRYYFISFAKSGRTWVRLFLNHYYFFLNPLSVTSRSDNKHSDLIPDIIYTHGNHNATELRLIEKFIKKLKNQNVIFMVRDPRDVFVSYYFQRTKRKKLPFKKYKIDWDIITMGEMIRNNVFGINRIIQYMNKWYLALDLFNRSYLIQYEKIKNDPYHEFKKLIEFIEDDVNIEALNKAIEETNFQKMNENERKRIHTSSVLSSFNSIDKESFKVRKGKVGGYVDYLTDSEIAYANEGMDKLNPDLNKLFLTTVE